MVTALDHVRQREEERVGLQRISDENWIRVAFRWLQEKITCVGKAESNRQVTKKRIALIN
jgi:hypothetical protein